MERETEKVFFFGEMRKKTIHIKYQSISFFKIVVYFSISLNEDMSDLSIYWPHRRRENQITNFDPRYIACPDSYFDF